MSNASLNWPVPEDMEGLLSQHSRRITRQERRPKITRAADLMGPGLAATAVELSDWNAEEVAFNGIYFSRPGAINGPDDINWWGGLNFADIYGNGYQHIRSYREIPMREFIRQFETLSSGLVFGSWSQL